MQFQGRVSNSGRDAQEVCQLSSSFFSSVYSVFSVASSSSLSPVIGVPPWLALLLPSAWPVVSLARNGYPDPIPPRRTTWYARLLSEASLAGVPAPGGRPARPRAGPARL